MQRVAPRGFADVDRHVADPLEVAVDFDGRHDGPQIRGHRRVQRQQLQAQVVHFDVQLVHRHVAVEHLVDQHGVALDKALHREPDALLGEASHGEQPFLQGFEFLLKVMAFHK